MLNKKDDITEQLRVLGLSRDEAKLYLELLRGPNTHLRLAQATGINRTKIYRLADDLEKRSLITRRTDDRGTFLVAADPSTLEITLVDQEEKLKGQRQAFDLLMPVLAPLKRGERSAFIIQTYEGQEGFKQMLWHELKAKDEVLIFGSGSLENLITDHRWAEKHRSLTIESGYVVREILNPGGKAEGFTENTTFMEHHYKRRYIPTSLITLAHQVVTYNDTVAIYHWREEQKVGVEIIDKDFAFMQRQIFEHNWSLASDK